MLRGLEREIAAQLRGIEDDRLMLAIHRRAFGSGLRRQLGTPKALAAGFGAGLAAAILFKRRPPETDAEAETPARAPKARLGRLAGWALRDLVLPAAIGLIAQAKAQDQLEPPEPPQFG